MVRIRKIPGLNLDTETSFFGSVFVPPGKFWDNTLLKEVIKTFFYIVFSMYSKLLFEAVTKSRAFKKVTLNNISSHLRPLIVIKCAGGGRYKALQRMFEVILL
jgi:hypothetical protein